MLVRAVLAVLVLALLGGVTACGGSSASREVRPRARDTAPVTSAATCAEVWVAGRPLPQGYAGCLLDGHLVAGDRRACSNGRTLVLHAGDFYAVVGEPVHHVPGLAGTAVYQRLTKVCPA